MPDGTPLGYLGLPAEIHNPLRYAGIRSVEHLRSLTEPELSALRNVGETRAAHILEALERFDSQGPVQLDPLEVALAALEEGVEIGNLDPDPPIEVLGLWIGSYNALRRAGIHTVEHLRSLTEAELLNFQNVGARRVDDIFEALERFDSHVTFFESGENADTGPFDPVDVFLASRAARDLDMWRIRNGLRDGMVITLEQVGESFGVTRERVRQITNRVEDRSSMRAGFQDLREQVRAAVGPVRFDYTWARLRALVAEVTDSLYPATPAHTAEDLEQRIDVALGVAGPYIFKPDSSFTERTVATVGTLWEEAFLKETLGEIREQIDSEVEATGPCVSSETAHGLLAESGVDPAFHARLVHEHLRLRPAFGGYISTNARLGSVLIATLRHLGEPSTIPELIEASGLDRTEGTVRNAAFEEEAIVRTSLTTYGLREWNLETYEGISEEIVQRIERDGGSTSLESLIDELSTEFGVSRTSVSMYANSQRFVVVGDRVRIREPHEAERVAPDLSRRADWWWLSETAVRVRLEVTRDVLRGSGMGIASPQAAALGVQYSESVTFQTEVGGEVRVAWIPSQMGPQLGAVRVLVEPLRLVEGDFVFVDFDIDDRTIHAHPAQTYESTVRGLIRTLAGVDTDSTADHVTVLSNLLGVERNLSTVLECLHDRGQGDLAGMVEHVGDPPSWPSKEDLHAKMMAAASGPGISAQPGPDSCADSVILTLESPGLWEFAAYCFTLGFSRISPGGTAQKGMRVTLPSHTSVEEARLEVPPDVEPLLIGYAPSLDVFLLWDTEIRQGPEGFARHEMLWINESLLYGAIGNSDGVISRIYGGNRETFVACKATALAEGLRQRRTGNIRRLTD